MKPRTKENSNTNEVDEWLREEGHTRTGALMYGVYMNGSGSEVMGFGSLTAVRSKSRGRSRE